ncbi:MAG: cyclodeaminase/cyclohydrolase family protein [Candidatus Limnocylindrus sp.]
MKDLPSTSLADYLDALAAATPAPGGGSAAGLIGAAGAALVEMVAGLSLAKGATEHTALQDDARRGAADARNKLLLLAEADANAYTAFIHALRLPSGSESERAARTEALSTAAQRAAEVPLATLRAAVAIAEAAQTLGGRSLLSAASDLAVAARFARAAGESAAENVEANLPYIEDAETRVELARQTESALGALQRATPQ